MLSKIKIFITLLVFVGILFTGCVDEPEMEILERPFTQLRVANYVTNADVLNVSIDNTNDGVDNYIAMNNYTDINGSAVVNNLQKGQFTAYFDVNSGDRNLLIKNNAGTVIYNSLQNMGSYEESILLFTGTYNDDEDLSTVTPIYLWIGQTYLDDYHQLPDPNGREKVFLEANQGIVKCIHAAQSVITSVSEDIAKEYTFVTLTNNDLGEIDTLLAVGGLLAVAGEPSYVGAIITDANYTIDFYEIDFDDVNGNDTLSTVSGTFDLKSGMTNLLILQGEPSNASFVKYEESIITTTRPR